MTSVQSSTPIDTKNLWFEKSPACQRHLIIKKIACTIIIAANLAGIGTLLAYVVMYCPLSTEILVFAPVIGGVVGALSYLKMPNIGITETNYESYLTPAFIVARTLTLLCFAPIVLAARHVDWTNYADPYEALRISEELKAQNFEEIVMKYSPKANNLQRYGFIQNEEATKLKGFYQKAAPFIKAKQFLLKEKAPQTSLDKNKTNLDKQQIGWDNLHHDIIKILPTIDPPIPDFSSSTTKVKLWIREYLGIYLFTIAR